MMMDDITMPLDQKKKRNVISYRFNIIIKQKLDKLKESGYFNDYTEIIDMSVSLMYDIFVNKKLPDYVNVIVEKVNEEKKE